jgi:hypothetical protein
LESYLKSIYLSFVAAYFLFFPPIGTAFKQDAPPSPIENSGFASRQQARIPTSVDSESPQNMFVGRYGEAIPFNKAWQVQPEMQGPIEVIRFHSKRVDPYKLGSPPYDPKPKDYNADQFASNYIVQILVIPKDIPGGIRSLKKLRTVKENELNRTGAKFRSGLLGQVDGQWPDDSFWVEIKAPYKLCQFYSQSDKQIFILTVGSDPLSRTNPHVREISVGLLRYLEQFPRTAESSFAILEDRLTMIPWATIVLIALILSLIPARRLWLTRVRLAGRTVLLFATLLPLFGFSALYVSWKMGQGAWLNRGSIDLVAELAIPWSCIALSKMLSGIRLKRVFLWSAGLMLFPVAVYLSLTIDYWQGVSTFRPEVDVTATIWELLAIAIIGGICFGVTHSPNDLTSVGRKVES